MPEAVVALGQAMRVVGRLRFESDGRRQHAQFEYDREWLEADDRFRLAPSLPLQAGGFFASGRGDRRNALHVCFQDAAPDSWGRALMTRALGGGLTEFEYLTLSDDHTRHGALRFLDNNNEAAVSAIAARATVDRTRATENAGASVRARSGARRRSCSRPCGSGRLSRWRTAESER
jgi:hypothetical protein